MHNLYNDGKQTHVYRTDLCLNHCFYFLFIFFLLLLKTNNSIFLVQGGVKAVVWTDTIQFIFTLAGLIAILFVGVKSIGFFKIWRIAARGQRLDILELFISHLFS